MGRYVAYSLIGHSLVILILGFRFFLDLDQPINFESSIHVDLVALPDKINPEQKQQPQEIQKPIQEEPPIIPPNPPEPPPPPTEAPPPEPTPSPLPPPKPIVMKNEDEKTINLDKAKKKQKMAFTKLKEMSAFDKLKQQIVRSDLKKGNLISSGSGLTGLNKIEADQYLSKVDHHIRQHWTLPEYLKNRNLKAEILVKFDESGIIILKNIVRSSGNTTFDEIVLAAVQKSSPVPPPPEKFVGISLGQGFLFRFSE